MQVFCLKWIISVLLLSFSILYSFAQTGLTYQAAKDSYDLYINSEPQWAITWADSMISLSSSTNDRQIESFLLSADANRRAGREDHQKSKIDKAFKLIEKDSTSKWALLAWNQLGLWQWKRAKYEEATASYLKVRTLAKVQNDTIGIIRSYNNIGLIYNAMGERKSAIKSYLSGLTFAQKINELFAIALLNNNVSIVYRHEQDYSLSIDHLKKSINAYKELDHDLGLKRALSNMGATFVAAGQPDSAIHIFSKLIDNDNSIPEAKVKHYYHMAEAYQMLNKGDKVLNLAKKLMDTARHYNIIDDIRYAHEMLSIGYEMNGQYSKSLGHFKSYHLMNDSLLDVEKTAKINELNIRYRTIENERQIQIERTKLAESNLLSEKWQSRLWQSVLLFTILTTITIMFYLIRKSRVKKLQQEKMTRKIILAKDKERKKIAADLHDGIAQNILFLKSTVSSQHHSLIDETLQDVRLISRELYPRNIEIIGITKSLESLVDQAEKHSNIIFSFDFISIDDYFTRDETVHLYRIVQECINNVIKHSEATAAKVSISLSKSILCLEVRDNGKGFSDILNSNEGHENGLGLTLLKERIDALGGRLILSNHLERGALYNFKIPIK